jgi:polysaccharide export outer membrane protein
MRHKIDYRLKGLLILSLVVVSGCNIKNPNLYDNSPEYLLESPKVENSQVPTPAIGNYLIGPGDTLNVFVWGNPDLSATIPVRPDGMISTPLVEDVVASGKTPSELARIMEIRLGRYVKNPVVTVTVTEFVGRYNEQVRVIGEASKPQALNYRENMTLLDVIIEVGGLTEYADGNNAKITRVVGGKQVQFEVKLNDLIKRGDIAANVQMRPGDILIIPESWF